MSGILCCTSRKGGSLGGTPLSKSLNSSIHRCRSLGKSGSDEFVREGIEFLSRSGDLLRRFLISLLGLAGTTFSAWSTSTRSSKGPSIPSLGLFSYSSSYSSITSSISTRRIAFCICSRVFRLLGSHSWVSGFAHSYLAAVRFTRVVLGLDLPTSSSIRGIDMNASFPIRTASF